MLKSFFRHYFDELRVVPPNFFFILGAFIQKSLQNSKIQYFSKYMYRSVATQIPYSI